MKLEYSRQFSKKNKISNFTKINPRTAEYIHADGQTDRTTSVHIDRQIEMTKLIVSFHNFSKAHINKKTRVVSTCQVLCHKTCPITIPGKNHDVLFNPPWLSEFAETVHDIILRNTVEGDHIFTET